MHRVLGTTTAGAINCHSITAPDDFSSDLTRLPACHTHDSIAAGKLRHLCEQNHSKVEHQSQQTPAADDTDSHNWLQVAGVEAVTVAPLDQESPGSSPGGATRKPCIDLRWGAFDFFGRPVVYVVVGPFRKTPVGRFTTCSPPASPDSGRPCAGQSREQVRLAGVKVRNDGGGVGLTSFGPPRNVNMLALRKAHPAKAGAAKLRVLAPHATIRRFEGPPRSPSCSS